MFSRVGATIIKLDSTQKVSIEGNKIQIAYNGKIYDYIFDKRMRCNLTEDNTGLRFTPNDDIIRGKASERKVKKIAGFHVRDLQNLLNGLVKPFKANLEIIGTGYKIVHNKQFCFLNISFGYSHDIAVAIPPEIIVEVNQNKIVLLSYSKRILGSFATYLVVSLRKFDKFKGKGIILEGRYLQRKELKKK